MDIHHFSACTVALSRGSFSNAPEISLLMIPFFNGVVVARNVTLDVMSRKIEFHWTCHEKDYLLLAGCWIEEFGRVPPWAPLVCRAAPLPSGPLVELAELVELVDISSSMELNVTNAVQAGNSIIPIIPTFRTVVSAFSRCWIEEFGRVPPWAPLELVELVDISSSMELNVTNAVQAGNSK